MRIGLDLILEPTTLTGTGIYARSLTRALAVLDRDNQYTVFLHLDNLPAFYLPEAENFRFRAYKFNAASPTTRRLAQQAHFAAGARRLGLDLLHSLTDLAPLLFRGRRVLTVHDLGPFAVPWRHSGTRLLRPLMAVSARLADQVIAVSGHTRRDLLHYLRLPEAKVTVVAHGVDTEVFSPEPGEDDAEQVRRLGIPEPYILFVGRLERGKGLLDLLEAYRGLPEALKERFTLALVGPDDNLAGELRRRAPGAGGRVVFTGHVEHGRLGAVYRRARLAVMPSAYEGFGLPALEAMACGTPVVATSVSSLPEVLGEAGILVPPGDVPALARALESLCTDDSLRAELALRGVERARSFSWERAARETLAVYGRLSSSGAGVSANTRSRGDS